MRKLLLGLLLSLSGVPASATTVHWTLENVVFSDGSTASGYLDYSNNFLTSYDISTSIGTLPATHYSVATGSTFGLASTNIQFLDPGTANWNYQFDLATGPIANLATPGVIDLGRSYLYDRWDGTILYATGGTLVSDVPAPEPQSVAIFGIGLLGLGLGRRAQKL